MESLSISWNWLPCCIAAAVSAVGYDANERTIEAAPAICVTFAAGATATVRRSSQLDGKLAITGEFAGSARRAPASPRSSAVRDMVTRAAQRRKDDVLPSKSGVGSPRAGVGEQKPGVVPKGMGAGDM